MMARRRRVIIVVATCLLSVPLTMWVVNRSPSEPLTITAPGAVLSIDVTPPLAPEGWQHALSTAPHFEPAAAPDSAADEGTSPLPVQNARTAVPPSSPVATAHTGSPQTEPSRHHDVSLSRGNIAAVLEARTRGYLHRLDNLENGADSPLGRVANVLTFLEPQQCAGGACQAAQQAIEAYLHARAALLRDMLEAFLASDGVYEGAREHQALQALHAAFTTEMATIAAHVPMLATLPDVLATTLRVPDYLEAPADDTRESQSLSHGDDAGVHGPHASPPPLLSAPGRP